MFKLNVICSDFFSQVLQWTKQRCLLLTGAVLVQKGSASSTTSRPSGTMNNELTICLGGTVWVWAQAVSMITDTLIIATTMHGFHSGIYLGIGVLIDFPQKTLDSRHSSSVSSTSHYRTNLTSGIEARVTYQRTENATFDSVEVGETPPPTSVDRQTLSQSHMLWAIFWFGKTQKGKTGQLFFFF